MKGGVLGLYLDNAATTFPKPECVATEVAHFINNVGFNISRGSYAGAFDALDAVSECRQALADLFGAEDMRDIAFTRCVTESLNLVLKGCLKPGDHVVVSSMEHNAIMRPLNQLAASGITYTRALCAADGSLNPADVEAAITHATKLVVVTHASNVCGTVLPLEQVGEVCSAHNIPFVVDAAQTAGVLPVSLNAMHASAICFTGHKGLLGPQGIGGIALGKEFAAQLEPLIAGGTGSQSDLEVMPAPMPDHLEAGTLNLPGIMGLRASLNWLKDQGIDNIRAHELTLTATFLEGLERLEQKGLVRIVGPRSTENRVGVVSVTTPQVDEATVAYRLDSDFDIQTRVGLHCAPSAHKTLGTYPTGTVRFSFGYANTADDVSCALAALETCCK